MKANSASLKKMLKNTIIAATGTNQMTNYRRYMVKVKGTDQFPGSNHFFFNTPQGAVRRAKELRAKGLNVRVRRIYRNDIGALVSRTNPGAIK